ncbi:hypothetical protein Mapa_016735 [Marchantia paleacea]|nr:hypothetical protein Mapa_016735 [Marchantia paleacea]
MLNCSGPPTPSRAGYRPEFLDHLANPHDLFCTPCSRLLHSLSSLDEVCTKTYGSVEATSTASAKRAQLKVAYYYAGPRATLQQLPSSQQSFNCGTGATSWPRAHNFTKKQTTTSTSPANFVSVRRPQLAGSIAIAIAAPTRLDESARSHRRDSGLTAVGCYRPGYSHGFGRQSPTPAVSNMELFRSTFRPFFGRE